MMTTTERHGRKKCEEVGWEKFCSFQDDISRTAKLIRVGCEYFVCSSLQTNLEVSQYMNYPEQPINRLKVQYISQCNDSYGCFISSLCTSKSYMKLMANRIEKCFHFLVLGCRRAIQTPSIQIHHIGTGNVYGLQTIFLNLQERVGRWKVQKMEKEMFILAKEKDIQCWKFSAYTPRRGPRKTRESVHKEKVRQKEGSSSCWCFSALLFPPWEH